jgi:hypothetical protein
VISWFQNVAFKWVNLYRYSTVSPSLPADGGMTFKIWFNINFAVVLAHTLFCWCTPFILIFIVDTQQTVATVGRCTALENERV